MALLTVDHLSVDYRRAGKTIPALRDVSLTLREGETLALVGESGCGKSTLALALMGLIPLAGGTVRAGEIVFNGRPLLPLSTEEWRELRGKDIAIVFQDPFSSLNPVLTIGEQMGEAVRAHRPGIARAELDRLTVPALEEVMFTDPRRILGSYPHQLSGGQRQRVVLATAILNRPKLLIADEPTTALDVTIQKEVLDLIAKLKRELALTVIFVTHNLPLAYERSERIAVMYAGEIVEEGHRDVIFRKARHPYTKGLIRSIPRLDGFAAAPLTGQPPDLSALPSGCPFHPRCPDVMETCSREEPRFTCSDDTCVRCHLYAKGDLR